MAKILVVEDNPSNRKLARVILTHAGHEVSEAVDAPQALEWCAQRLPDLVLMDVQLPGMDGLSASERLRALPGALRLPILAVTALAMPEDRSRIAGSVCNDVLTKPYSPAQLLALVDKWLSFSQNGPGKEEHHDGHDPAR